MKTESTAAIKNTIGILLKRITGYLRNYFKKDCCK